MRCIRKTMWFIAALSIVSRAQDFSEIRSWRMQDSAAAGAADGEVISAPPFDASSWYAATVPGTVLNTLVDCKVYPDPNFGLNMLDIPDLAAQQRRYWFRASFDVSFSPGRRVWLEFGGINYVATIFLNGKQVGAMYGAFREATFDVTDKAVPGTNYLAVKIRGNYTPGVYKHKESGMSGNGGPMTKDGPTFIASQGWDFMPTIPDRCMGIWKPVYVRVTGPVAIRHPWIRTLDVSASGATVPLQVMLKNATGSPISGTLCAAIGSTIQFAPQTVTVPADDTLNVDVPAVTMTNPKLWWPNGYGEPNLYSCHISFTPNGSASPSDTAAFRFGVREYSFTTSGSGYGSLVINCNGRRILARGGNWGMDDAMKRWDVHKTRNKVRYHKEMNFNMIRDWIGMTDNEPFYGFCDEYGIMVWADFWQPHSADGPTAVDTANFIANMRDKVHRVRNHASLAVWCARNETIPTPAFLDALQEFHATLDGTRMVQASSGSGGVHSGGPYVYMSPANAYAAMTGFHTELGGPVVMSIESMVATLPEANMVPMAAENKWWAFHDYFTSSSSPNMYGAAMNTLFGKSSAIGQFCMKAQLMNYDCYRAYLEALQARRFTGATGLLLWMSNCAWPSLMWQTYDYYLEGTGAMYGSQKGSEPVHVMYYGTGNYQVSVVNNTERPLIDHGVRAATYNLDGTKAWDSSVAVSVGVDTSFNVFPITPGSSKPYFLDLKLRDATGRVVSKNFYWLPSSGQNISAMLTMNRTTVPATADGIWTKSGVENTISLTLVNTGSACAVACRLQLTGATSGRRILPVHYNDNYFSLIPGDTQTVEIKFDEVDRKGEEPKLTLSGVNVDLITLKIGAVDVARRNMADPGYSKLHATYIGNVLRLHNVPRQCAWRVKLFDMLGHTVLEAAGDARTAPAIRVRELKPGAYIVAVAAGEKRLKTLVVVDWGK